MLPVAIWHLIYTIFFIRIQKLFLKEAIEQAKYKEESCFFLDGSLWVIFRTKELDGRDI